MPGIFRSGVGVCEFYPEKKNNTWVIDSTQLKKIARFIQ
jgi:hypothetical protein